jgi:hypothetical protein
MDETQSTHQSLSCCSTGEKKGGQCGSRAVPALLGTISIQPPAFEARTSTCATPLSLQCRGRGILKPSNRATNEPATQTLANDASNTHAYGYESSMTFSGLDVPGGMIVSSGNESQGREGRRRVVSFAAYAR